MVAWDPPRNKVLEYGFHIPAFVDVEAWMKQKPTLTNVSPNTVCPGCVVVGEHELWLCMAALDQGSDVDVHWVRWMRATGKMDHRQQVFRRHSSSMWAIAVYTLDSKPKGDYCPHCNIKLEWAAIAERCPQCWWVKDG